MPSSNLGHGNSPAHGESFRIARAVPSQAASLSEIARKAKAGWGYPAHWMETWREALTIRADEIGVDEYFVAVLDEDDPVGFCSVSGAPEANWRLEHLWVLPEWQGVGVGSRLFETAAAHARKWGGKSLDIRADPNAAGFYLRLGAVRIGETFVTMDGVARSLPELRYALV